MTDQTTAFTLPSGYSQSDVSEESYREYVYPNGDILEVQQPVTLYITPTGGHRVVDMNGVTTIPARGWVGIRFKQANGQPFSF